MDDIEKGNNHTNANGNGVVEDVKENGVDTDITLQFEVCLLSLFHSTFPVVTV